MSAKQDVQQEFDSLVGSSKSFDRRSFVTHIVAGSFALATQPIMAQSVIKTDDTGLDAGATEVSTDGFAMPVYYARPKTGSGFPVVLVVQEIFGVHEYIQDVCRRLAKQGYLAIAPALHARAGDASKIAEIPRIQSEIVAKVADEQVMRDLDNMVAWAKGQKGNAERLAITGFCWGGRIVWLYAAHQAKVKAGIAWYGRLNGASTPMTPKHPLELVERIKAPILGLYGEADSGIPMTDVNAMRTALKAAGSKSDIISYPDTPHAFHADYRPSYREAAAKDGWQRLLTWLNGNL